MSEHINIITQQIESKFNDIENNIFSGTIFSQWRGSFEVKKVYLKKENADIKCDLDIRLKNWPEGIFVKVYKHKALAVLPYVKDQQVCEEYLSTEATPCKFWKDAFYFSNMTDLDQDRYVLLEGNNMSDEDTDICLSKLKTHIEEINTILANR
ncbi:hypothetical protein [Colwellia psychrerythraea]|uniref:Uncharacterized protein n=1 Tax=Colwellia psychrerythraea TaxID=28229 RepID=A0A099KM55_COLPS|nr:hypothetical protein [Colwellia psychrerythraea]KGJ91536.1 hypothetical protein ND2E_3401 [Colwellia psychrerythraea]